MYIQTKIYTALYRQWKGSSSKRHEVYLILKSQVFSLEKSLVFPHKKVTNYQISKALKSAKIATKLRLIDAEKKPNDISAQNGAFHFLPFYLRYTQSRLSSNEVLSKIFF